MKIPYISVSRKNVWDLCQLKYKFQYHMGVKPDMEEPSYFIYGKIVHRAAECYIDEKGKRPITEIAQDILKGKIELEEGQKSPPLPEDYKKKFPAHLKAICKLTEQTGFDGKVEYQFKYDLDPPNKRMIYGYIDRLIQKGNKFWILDYKTTKQGWWRKGKNEIVNDLQLKVYARVVQHDFKAKAENIKAALFYLEGEELVGATFSQETLLNAEQELLQTYMNIENTKAEQAFGRVGEHCKRCEFRKICPTYSLT